MSRTQVLIAVFIHLVIPAIGITWYIRLSETMRKTGVSRPLIFQMFLVFTTYGTLLVLMLTAFLWKWSGMASLGVLYLLGAAPFIMLFIALINYSTRKESKYHLWLFRAGTSYFVILPACIILSFNAP